MTEVCVSIDGFTSTSAVLPWGGTTRLHSWTAPFLFAPAVTLHYFLETQYFLTLLCRKLSSLFSTYAHWCILCPLSPLSTSGDGCVL